MNSSILDAAAGGDDDLSYKQQLALRFHRQGLQVVPLHPEIFMPYRRNGVTWEYGRRNTEIEVIRWFADPYPVVGLAAGTASKLMMVSFKKFLLPWFMSIFPRCAPAMVEARHAFDWYFSWHGEPLEVARTELPIKVYAEHRCVPAPYDDGANGRRVLKALPSYFPGGCQQFQIKWLKMFEAESAEWQKARREAMAIHRAEAEARRRGGR